jgi:hypothetical protein
MCLDVIDIFPDPRKDTMVIHRVCKMLFCTVSSRVQYTINCTLSHKQTELGKFSEKIFATKLPLLEEREKIKSELKKNT